MMSLNKENTEKQEIQILPAQVQNKPQEISFPIVGIGASAGGLAAFEAFFSGMPSDVETGMAFVLIQHLSPEHKSILPDIISRYTRMKVFEVTNGMKVRPDCVYVIPPDCNMTFQNGVLELAKPASLRQHRLPIDMFFRSLAINQQGQAIGIIFSGTGSDGTLGVRAIKGEGGLVMAQKPESTEYDGMPLSAIGTGLVDYVLLPAEMPAKLIAYISHSLLLPHLPAAESLPNARGNALNKIFILLHAHTRHDFSQYKMTTISRRIERRMAIQQITDMERYVEYLQQTPAEVEALFRDMLIGVTNFFRDPKAFEELEKRVIPGFFKGRHSDSVIRIWSSGCSTGEEAYSIAILLAEYQASIKRSFKVQLFATDIDSNAIAVARAGLYPASIAADVSQGRLTRFFTEESGGNFWRINKNIRDMLVFSEHNIIKDPPFSRLELISCRNLMIYLNQKLQKQILPRLHYSLNPGGVLFLGTSETTGEFLDLFSTIDNKMKIYQRKEGFTSVPPTLPVWSGNPVTAIMAGLPQDAGKIQSPIQRPMRSLIENALLQFMPAALLVNDQGDIFHIYGRTGMFLEPMQGDSATNNILKMAREGLLHQLTVTLNRAVTTKMVARYYGIRVKTNGDFTTVNLIIRPLMIDKTDSSTDTKILYLVTIEEVPPETKISNKPSGESDSEARYETLRLALQVKEEYLQITREELQTSNEEFQSSNEEMQSMNEELQSTNEELETSREELQSVNEELSTVNSELQNKVAELSKANNDINNLLSGTGIATVFVDHQLCILNFTPSMSTIINLIPTDVGRSVTHFVSNLIGYDSMVADIQTVLTTLIPKEVKVQTKEGRFYRMRIQPYLTINKAIEGAVITLVDITDEEDIRERLRKANEELRLAVVVRDSWDAITVHDMHGRILAWNPGAVRMFGWSEAEALSMNILDRIPESLKKEEMLRLHQLSHAEILEPYLTRRLTKDGLIMEVSIISTPLVNEAKHVYAIATTERMKALTMETD